LLFVVYVHSDMMLMKDEAVFFVAGMGTWVVMVVMVVMGVGWEVEKARAIAVNWSRTFAMEASRGCAVGR